MEGRKRGRCREAEGMRVEPSIHSLAAQNDNPRREFIGCGDASERRREGRRTADLTEQRRIVRASA